MFPTPLGLAEILVLAGTAGAGGMAPPTSATIAELCSGTRAAGRICLSAPREPFLCYSSAHNRHTHCCPQELVYEREEVRVPAAPGL